ncbi:hypothetical protein OTU49_000147, partial [Cherax quadricarinatus]
VVYNHSSGSSQEAALSCLVARLEGRPARVLLWGLSTLLVGTLVQVFLMVLTYVVVVEQLSPSSTHRAWAPQVTLTPYDHCFLQNVTEVPPIGLLSLMSGTL